MNMDINTIGLKGSATQVRKIFSPERDKGEILAGENDKTEDAAKKLIEKMVSKDLLSL
jgi:electron transfer flavoprotein beta subunit